MSSRLERAISQHRAAVAANDQAVARAILRSIEIARKRLQPYIVAAQQEVEQSGNPSDESMFELERWKHLEGQLVAQMNDLARQTGIALTKAQRAAVQRANADARMFAEASTPQQRGARALAQQWSAVPEQALHDLVGAINPGTPVGKLLGTFGREGAAAARAALVEGVALSRSIDSVAPAIEKTLNVSRNRALTIARTEIMRAQRSSMIRTYQENSDILRGWRWHAARTARTCPACLAMDGTVFPLDVAQFPGHPACRCVPLPVLIDDDEPPFSSANEWLHDQRADVQDAVLGKSGAAAFRAGEIQLEHFARRRSSPTWGMSFADGGVGWARRQAERRGGSGAQLAQDRTRIEERARGIERLHDNDEIVRLGSIPEEALAPWPARVTNEVIVTAPQYRHIVEDHPDRKRIVGFANGLVNTVLDPDAVLSDVQDAGVANLVRAFDARHDMVVSVKVSHSEALLNSVLSARLQRASRRKKEKERGRVLWER